MALVYIANFMILSENIFYRETAYQISFKIILALFKIFLIKLNTVRIIVNHFENPEVFLQNPANFYLGVSISTNQRIFK